MSFFDTFSDKISFVAEKIDDNKYLAVIKDTFSTFMPFIIVGSFATLGRSLLSSEVTGLARFTSLNFLSAIDPAFSALNFATMSVMTLGIVFILSTLLAKRNKGNELLSAMVAFSAYVSVVPQGIENIVDGVESIASGLPVSTIDASALFIGMILTIIVVEIFCKLSKFEKLKIKMPASVPQAISKSFNALIPVFITLFVVTILGRLFVIATNTYLNEFIYQVLQAPLEGFFQTSWGVVAVAVLSQAFWLVGIHGGLVISPFRAPIMAAALAANIAAYESGFTPENAITMSTWRAFINIGGAGLVLSAAIALLIASKRPDQKSIAKLGFVPAVFSISEPLAFGLPLVLNPVFAIPFVFNAGISTIITMLAFNLELLTPNFVDVPFGLPIILNAFLGWGIPGVILQIIIIGVGVLTYLPFVFISNRQAINEK